MLPAERFRHIIFPAALKQRPKVINLAAAREDLVAKAEPDCDLSEEAASFLDWLFAQAGLEARRYRPETLQRRLSACLRAARPFDGAGALFA